MLQDSLRAWLTGNKWSAGRWGEFEAEVRRSGENKVLKKVRA